jgi:hypothetical protein
MLRLRPGNYWTYAGTVEWSVPNQGAKTGKKMVRWKTEIAEQTRHGELKAYLVTGSPFDLAWYEPSKKPGQYVWIVYQNRFYMLAADPDMLKRFRDAGDPLTDLVEKDDPVLQLPLAMGKCNGILKPAEPRERPDLRYCWYIENKRTKMIGATGVSRSARVWEASNFTNPDEEHIGFAPGVGIVSYDYRHHGTVAEAHVKLIETHLQ